MQGRPVPVRGVPRGGLRGGPRRPEPVERRRRPLARRAGGRRGRLPGQPGWSSSGRWHRRRGPRRRGHLRRCAGVEPLRAQRALPGRPAPDLQARVARGPARARRGAARRRPRGAGGPLRRLERRPDRRRRVGRRRLRGLHPRLGAGAGRVRGCGRGGLHRRGAPPRPRPGVYTYWDYKQLRFPRREGMRIDFALCSPRWRGGSRGAFVDREERKGKGASDHAPVVVDLR